MPLLRTPLVYILFLYIPLAICPLTNCFPAITPVFFAVQLAFLSFVFSKPLTIPPCAPSVTNLSLPSPPLINFETTPLFDIVSFPPPACIYPNIVPLFVIISLPSLPLILPTIAPFLTVTLSAPLVQLISKALLLSTTSIFTPISPEKEILSAPLLYNLTLPSLSTSTLMLFGAETDA